MVKATELNCLRVGLISSQSIHTKNKYLKYNIMANKFENIKIVYLLLQ